MGLAGASAAGLAVAINSPLPAQAASPRSAALIWIDYTTRTAERAGRPVAFGDVAAGDGRTGGSATNLFGAALPFSGGSLETNRLPTGIEWHGSSSPKSLVAQGQDSIAWRGQNPDSRYFGGVRTTFEVAQPGQTVILSMRASISSVQGAQGASLRASLLRTSDGRSTLLERTTTHLETDEAASVVKLRAPAGGTGGFRLALTGEAGSAAFNQSATFSVRDIGIYTVANSSSNLSRYSAPPYVRAAWNTGSASVKHSAPAGRYQLLLRTAEAGWFGVPFDVQTGQTTTLLKDVLSQDERFTLLELMMIPDSQWVNGWLGTLAGAGAWKPVRYMELTGASGSPRPESLSRLSRASDRMGATSVLRGEATDSFTPSLDAPAETWACSYNTERRSYLRFETNQRKYVGETTDPSGVRSEMHYLEPLEYNTDYWFSFYYRTTSDLQDAQDSRRNILFQVRYTKNTSGDSSALSPEFALEQMIGSRFSAVARTDGGKAVLAGAGTPDGITTRTSQIWTAPLARWQRIVVRLSSSPSGGGSVRAWVDGNELSGLGGPVGYRRNVGPKVRHGSYKFADSPGRVEFQNFEFGRDDLSSRISRPLPI